MFPIISTYPLLKDGILMVLPPMLLDILLFEISMEMNVVNELNEPAMASIFFHVNN